MLETVIGGAALQVVVDDLLAGRGIVGVDRGQPEFRGGLHFAGRIAELDIPVVVDHDPAGRYVGVPQPFIGGIHGIAQALLAGVQGGLEAVAFVDIAPDGQAVAAAQVRDRHLHGQG